MSLILGLSVSTLIDLPLFPSLTIIAIAVTLAGLSLLKRVRCVANVGVAAAMVIVGLAMGSLERHAAERMIIPHGDLDRGVRLVCDGVVRDGPVRREKNAHFDVRLVRCRMPQGNEMQPAAGTVRLYSSPDVVDVAAGDVVRFKATLRKPRDFLNEGCFSWRRYLTTKGVGAVGSLAGPHWIVQLSTDAKGLRTTVLPIVRKRLDAAIETIGDADTIAILQALVSGHRDALSEKLRESFQQAGVAHILAISGLHVGYIALCIFFALAFILGCCTRLLLVIPLQRIAAVLTLPLVWGFVFLVGAPVSAVRASIMISVYLAGVIVGMRRDLPTTMAIAALIIVAIEPMALFDVSFQLSFVSVLAIILMVPRLIAPVEKWFAYRCRWYHRLLWRSYQLACVTVAATIGSAPLVAYHFHFVTGAGLFANLLAVPWTGAAIIPLAALSSVMTFVWPSAAVAAFWPLTGMATAVLIKISAFFSWFASPLSTRIAPTVIEVAIVYAFILVVVFWRRLSYRRIAFAVLVAALVIDVGCSRIRPMMTNTLEVTFFDVGQGEAMLVRFPGGRTMLIDGGGSPQGEFDVGRDVVAPALLRKGIHRIDWLLLTHPHHDHYRGLGAIAEWFHPERLWTNGVAAPEEEREFWGDFLRRVDEAGVPLNMLDAAHELADIGGVKLAVLSPPRPPPADVDPNDTSIVLKLTYGDVSFLFTGDLMGWGERRLVDSGRDIHATVLKVAHHGSKTSSSAEFLEAVRPRVAVMSLGRYNAYGMPDAEVVDRLERAGVKIYRTDLHGAVTISTDGHDWEVDTVVK